MQSTKPGFKKHPMAKAIAVTAAGSLLTTMAIAQDEPVQLASKGLEEIIVSGTKRAMDIQDVTQSITAFTPDEIDKRGFGNTLDFAKSIPGLTTVTTVPGRNEIVFRGVSQGQGEWRLESSSAVYLGSIPMTSATQSIDPYIMDMAGIESLPGPQGTRYGSSSQSGALVYLPQKPDHSVREAEISISGTHMAEGDPGHTAEAWVNIPIIEDTLTVRAAVYDVKDGGWIDNIEGTNIFTDDTNASAVEDNYNSWEQEGYRISALWSINESWDVDFMYIDHESRSEGSWSSDPDADGHDDFDTVRFHKDVRTDEWWLASFTVTGDLGFAELSYTASKVDREIFYEFDSFIYSSVQTQQAREYDWGEPNPYLADGVTPNPYYAYYSAWYNSLYDTSYRPGTAVNDPQENGRETHEIRLLSQGDSRFQWMLGAFHEDGYDEWDYSYLRIPDLQSTQFGQYNYWYDLSNTDDWYYEEYENNVKQIAIFGEMTYELTDQLTVGFGARWFEYDTDRTDIKEWPRGYPLDPVTYEAEEEDTIFMFDVSYSFTDDVRAFYHYSEGPRLGGENSKSRQSSVLPETFDEDMLINHEIGLKSQWLDNSLQFNAAYYWMEWQDMQQGITDPANWENSGTINVGDVEFSGFEATLKYQVTENLYVDASLNLTDSEAQDTIYASDVISTITPMSGDDWILIAEGQQTPINPDEKWSIGIEYEIPNIDGGDINLWFRYDHYWQAAMYHDWWNAQNEELYGYGDKLIESQDQASFQMSLYVEDDWSLNLNVWNVWDDRWVNWVDSGYDWAFGEEGRWAGQTNGRYVNSPNYIPPRELELNFTKKFEF